jgi:predicted metal-binding protein
MCKKIDEIIKRISRIQLDLIQVLDNTDDFNDVSESLGNAKEKLANIKPKVEKKPKNGGIDKYFHDLEKWENSFYCNECGRDEKKDFAYDRTVANGEAWHCTNCKTEFCVGNKPNEDNY